MGKVKISILPEHWEMEFEQGILLLDALSDMGAILKTPCGGKGICGKCKVEASGQLSNLTFHEQRHLPPDKTQRLACQASVLGDTIVHAGIRIDNSALYKDITIPPGPLGIAVDVGTTSIQSSLVDKDGSRIVLLHSFLNPQRRYGHDIISRIAASSEPSGPKTISKILQNAINKKLREALELFNIGMENISCISFSGNTIMIYFLFGLDTRPLGRSPYTLEKIEFSGYSTANIGLTYFAKTPVKALPVNSAFLGGDFTGGLLFSEMNRFRKNIFFIDLGTNGEIFVKDNEGKTYATSCAMGPALEGMNIEFGMTAEEGAIDHVRLVGGEEKFEYSVIGNIEPVGLCGTALIDIISLLLDLGIIQANGAFTDTAKLKRSPLSYTISETGKISHVQINDDISLSQKDVRNIQLAKGASLAASNILLKNAGINATDIEHVLIAGSFGENLEMKNFIKTRFIPKFRNAQYQFLGNTSLKAAEISCFNKDFCRKASKLRDRLVVLDLSNDPDFNDEFIRCLDF